MLLFKLDSVFIDASSAVSTLQPAEDVASDKSVVGGTETLHHLILFLASSNLVDIKVNGHSKPNSPTCNAKTTWYHLQEHDT